MSPQRTTAVPGGGSAGLTAVIHAGARLADPHAVVAAEYYYHPTRIEIVSSILDDPCTRLGGHARERADEETG